ncbi:hypothetical protein C9374_011419 [Naegleria lovaniensis]|uniref:FHA domain-containing protein n=1 Tax=Naegleria lovaniensis TaxID=51637 RepID=A0AA88KRI5_NAELO|nr:uncharacterized protein C9374_011419 [Naegleria lovaniensis]KAG2392694.1 hypothetical protein C9374_011419 [Naegleria lovaniensis]
MKQNTRYASPPMTTTTSSSVGGISSPSLQQQQQTAITTSESMLSSSPPTLHETNSFAVQEEEDMVYGYLKGTNESHYVLDKKKMIIGKNADTCDIVLPNSKTISGEHAKIEFRKTSNKSYQCILTDLQSQNGTLVNDKRLFVDVTMKQLNSGDKLRFGFDNITYTIELLFDPEPKNRESMDERGFIGVNLNPDFKPAKSKMRKSKSFDKLPMSKKPVAKVSKQFKEKLESQQKEFKSLLEQRRTQKKSKNDPSTLTFQTATGSKTVPLSELESDNEEDLVLSESHETPNEDFNEHGQSMTQNINNTHNTNRHNSENSLDKISERLVNIEKTIMLDQKKEEKDLYHMNVLVNTVHLLAHKLLNQNAESQQTAEKFIDHEKSMTMKEIMIEKLTDIKKTLMSCLTQNERKAGETEKKIVEQEAFRSQGLERYATELQNELDNVRFELERKNLLIEELKRQTQDRKKDQDTIKTLRECLDMKDKDMKEIQAQLTSHSLVGYTSEAAKSRMQNLISNLMKDLEESKRKNHEYQIRLDKRLFEWQQLKEENKKLSFRASELQETIHRQMNDLHVVLMHKEQKINAWKSKVAELASDNNEMRYRASSFLLSLISEGDRKDTELVLKYEEVKRSLSFTQMENNELRMEINNLKDVLQYTDTHSTKHTIDMLKDKIHQMEIECSVERVIEMQNTIETLNSKVYEMERLQALYQHEISRTRQQQRPFNEDACVASLERTLQLYEKKVESLSKQLDEKQMLPSHVSSNDLLFQEMVPKKIQRKLSTAQVPLTEQAVADKLKQADDVRNLSKDNATLESKKSSPREEPKVSELTTNDIAEMKKTPSDTVEKDKIETNENNLIK